MLEYVSRADWGAPAGDPAPSDRFAGPLLTVWVHTGAVPLQTVGDPNEERAHCRSYERTALDRGWTAVGYSALVGLSGAAYVGRGLHMRSGANAGAHNDNALSVCVIGHGDVEPLTPAAQATLHAVVQDMMHRHGVTTVRLLGHREEPTSKSCPGTHPFGWVQANRDHDSRYVIAGPPARRRKDRSMILIREDGRSGVQILERMHTMVTIATDADRQEIGKALATGDHVAVVSSETFDRIMSSVNDQR